MDDIIQLSSGQMPVGVGSVAARLLASGLRIESLRTNDVLRKDEWLLYDTAVVQVARAGLVGVADLLSRNLRVDITNAMGITQVQWDKMSDMSEANVNMSGVTEGERSRLDFTQVNLPVPIVHKDFQINLRTLESSRRGGTPLDTTQATVATRRVVDMNEKILFNGASIQGGGGVIYGYTNFPARNTGSVTASWALAGTSGDSIVGDILTKMIPAMHADNMFGPYILYVPVAVYANLARDYKAESDRTILDRILAIPGIEAVRPTTELSGTNVVLVQMTSDVVDMIVGFQPMPVMWETHGGFMLNFKVLSIMVPRLKSDYDGRCGIVHLS